MTQAIVLVETYSTPVRIETVARKIGNMHFMVLPDGDVKTLAKVPKGVDQITVALVKEKTGDRIFTPWAMTYIVPPEAQLEATWNLVQRLLKTHKVPNVICGVSGPVFRWGWVESLIGIAARERVMPHQGGVVPEFYCLARSYDMSPSDARNLAIAKAPSGESFVLPNGATHDTGTRISP